MKRLVLLLFACLLSMMLLSACDRGILDQGDEETIAEADFAPETTSAAGSGLMMAVEDAQKDDDIAFAEQPEAVDMPAEDEALPEEELAEDAIPVDEETADEVSADGETAEEDPDAAALVPSAHEAISAYSEVSSDSLGFKFSYPANWDNLPGRSSVCYKQPASDTEGYPARVCITMKKLAHKANAEKAQNQMISYLKNLRTQYDASTFEVDKKLNTKTKFMGNNAISCNYLAYDGEQEIEGYVIMTYFDKYIYCYHFLCSYDDYKGYNDAMCYMRDSARCTLKLD